MIGLKMYPTLFFGFALMFSYKIYLLDANLLLKGVHSDVIADRTRFDQKCRTDLKNIPLNDEIDWEVDQLGRVQILIPAFTKKEAVTEAEVTSLVKALDNPKTFAVAHVILSRLYSNSDSIPCVTTVQGGFDIRLDYLYVQLRYVRNGSLDHKSIAYPDTPKYGSQQAFLARRWKKFIAWRKEAGNGDSSADRVTKSHKTSTVHWCDSRSFDLKNVNNDRITWVGAGLGHISPVLKKVHRNEIARGNRKHVPHLLSLLKDKSRFASAHIALSCIFGIDSFCQFSTSDGQEINLNGLQLQVNYDKKQGWKTTFPNAARQQAWIQYRWMTFVQFEMKGNKKK